MWWTKFEQELQEGYVIYDLVEQQQVFPDDMKLRKLQGKIKTDFLLIVSNTNIDSRRPHKAQWS